MVDEHAVRVFRRLAFIAALALLGYGAGLGLRDRPLAEEFMGWGGALLGFTLPLGRWWQRRD